MTDIPEDVLKLAREVWSACIKADLGWSKSNPAEVIARAIMADRAAQAERMARLEEALRVFAELASRYDTEPTILIRDSVELWQIDRNHGMSLRGLGLTVGHLRSARAARALSQEGSDA